MSGAPNTYKLVASRTAANINASAIFFYHLPKCAGTYLHSAVRTAWTFPATGSTQPPLLGRVDNAENLNSLATMTQPPSSWVSSHLPYGAHHRLCHRQTLMTLLRDPVDRVRSAFTYGRMRNAQPVRIEDYSPFIQQECNRNIMTKTLAGVDAQHASTDALMDKAIATLQTEFAIFAEQSRLEQVLTDYLHQNGLPNLLLPQVMNATTADYCIDGSDFTVEVDTANSLDRKLYDFVCANERHPTPAAGAELHPQTVLAKEKHVNGVVTIQHLAFNTQELQNIGIIRPDRSIDDRKLSSIVARYLPAN